MDDNLAEQKNVPSQKQKNPFYFLLVVTGIVFAITACSYSVMTVTYLHASAAPDGGQPLEAPLLRFLDLYGFELMSYELGALCLFVVAAIVLDQLRDQRADNEDDSLRHSDPIGAAEISGSLQGEEEMFS